MAKVATIPGKLSRVIGRQFEQLKSQAHEIKARRNDKFGGSQKKSRNDCFGSEGKIWRQPTLAEAIQPLPSARLCLTAEFGMGSGRTTALWSPKN